MFLSNTSSYQLDVAHTWTDAASFVPSVELYFWLQKHAAPWTDVDGSYMAEYTYTYGPGGDFTGKAEYTLTLDFVDVESSWMLFQFVLELGTFYRVYSVSSVKDHFDCLYDIREECIKYWDDNG
jgi:hypothetical protein